MKDSTINRLRRRAACFDMRVERSRSRDPDALDFGGFALIDNQSNGFVLGGGPLGLCSCSVEDLAAYLDRIDAQLVRERAS